MSNASTQRRAARILLVEDNPADVELTREGFGEIMLVHDLYVARDGSEAIAFLCREGKFADAPRPDLILLDLNLPGREGHDVLSEIKSDVSLRRVPVIVLSSSRSERDISRAYESYANAYMTKPTDFDGVVKTLQAIVDYWFGVVRLPSV